MARIKKVEHLCDSCNKDVEILHCRSIYTGSVDIKWVCDKCYEEVYDIPLDKS